MSVVYFLQSGIDGPVKIGFARYLPNRVKLLQCGNPELLTVLATIAGDALTEGYLHRLHKTDRLRGEWFAPTPAVLETVAQAKAGSLTIETEVVARSLMGDAERKRAIAEITGAPFNTVSAWAHRNSIPSKHWKALIQADLAEADELIAGAAQQIAA